MIEVCARDPHFSKYLLGRAPDKFSSNQIKKGFLALYDRCKRPNKDRCKLESYGVGIGKKCIECQFRWNGVSVC